MPATVERKHVHRGLSRGDQGPDVRRLQGGINRTAAHWKLDHLTVEEDGQLGRQTGRSASDLLYAMGAFGKAMDRAHGEVFSEYAQKLIRGTQHRNKRMRTLARVRRPTIRRWRQKANPLRLRAYRVALGLVGVMEEGGNNTCRKVSEIIRSNGGIVGEPWCGDFQAYCYRNAGSKAVTRSWASVSLLGSIVGVTRTSHPETGDLVRFDFDHVGMFVRWLGDGYFEAIEGNTGESGAVSDSTTGGDGVYRKRRHISQVNDFLCVTR